MEWPSDQGSLEAAHSDGYPDDVKVKIVFLEIKTGKTRLDKRQRLIRQVVEAGDVYFKEHRIQLGEASLAARAVTASASNELTVGSVPDEEVGELGIGLGGIYFDD